jgi:diguanylate cyclase (GGDEF)-like protein
MRPLHQRYRISLTIAAIVVVLFISRFDLSTNPEFGLALVYLVPVIACGWWLGAASAGTVAAVAGVAFFVADSLSRDPTTLQAATWNALTKLTIFLSLGIGAARVRDARDRLTVANLRLEEMLAREATLARTDALTMLPNLRSFFDYVRTEVSRRQRHRRPLCVAYLDLDNFKQVNDQYGHAAGDELLTRVGAMLRESIRGGDLFARIGGDEFALVFDDPRLEHVELIARRLATRITELGKAYERAGVSASIGIAFFTRPPTDAEEILRAADAAMYEAKSAGKNGLAVHSVAAEHRERKTAPGG